MWLGANDAITEGTWQWIQDVGDGVELRTDNSRWRDTNFGENKDSLALALEVGKIARTMKFLEMQDNGMI